MLTASPEGNHLVNDQMQSFSNKRLKKIGPLSRTVGALSALSLVATVGAGCALGKSPVPLSCEGEPSSRSQTTPSYELSPGPDGKVIDQKLLTTTGERIVFFYDSAYIDRDFPTAGSIGADVSTPRSGVLRIASWEEEAAPGTNNPDAQRGGLVDVTFPYPNPGSVLRKHPVTGQAVGERDKVAIGFDSTRDANTAKKVQAREYELTRTPHGEVGRFIGTEFCGPTILLRNQ
ncbi:MAG: hypothetical protein ACR2LN_00420 [Candidatus Levyibacteriota bacterium]